jgi:hypothetical protein
LSPAPSRFTQRTSVNRLAPMLSTIKGR